MPLQIHIAQPLVGTHIQYPDPLLALSSLYAVYSILFPPPCPSSPELRGPQIPPNPPIFSTQLLSTIESCNLLCCAWFELIRRFRWIERRRFEGGYRIGKELDRKLQHQKLWCIPDVPLSQRFYWKHQKVENNSWSKCWTDTITVLLLIHFLSFDNILNLCLTGGGVLAFIYCLPRLEALSHKVSSVG